MVDLVCIGRYTHDGNPTSGVVPTKPPNTVGITSGNGSYTTFDPHQRGRYLPFRFPSPTSHLSDLKVSVLPTEEMWGRRGDTS